MYHINELQEENHINGSKKKFEKINICEKMFREIET
jgi:hypothetical protein